MPVRNMRGGKAYKKGKKGKSDDDSKISEKTVTREEGQDYARVTKMLGKRRVLCFCNDGEVRVCKIRGALCRGPKKQFIEIGDIVLISLREFESEPETHTAEGGTTLASGNRQIADIILKYDKTCYRYIRKESGIHRHLLSTTTDSVEPEDDIIFESNVDSEDDEKENENQPEVVKQPFQPDTTSSDSDIDIENV